MLKTYIWNPATSSCKSVKYLASISDDSVVTFHEIIDTDAEAKSYDKEIKPIPKKTCETRSFYILLAFSLITIELLIAVRIYCYLIKYKAK